MGHVGGDSGRLILKLDGEWSIKALKDALGNYFPEVSACGESLSNGCCEQAAQGVAEFSRVLKEQAERNLHAVHFIAKVTRQGNETGTQPHNEGKIPHSLELLLVWRSTQQGNADL